jgi:hypothetical protein
MGSSHLRFTIYREYASRQDATKNAGEHGIAVKAFELSQNLRAKWFEADYSAKRRILEIIG